MAISFGTNITATEASASATSITSGAVSTSAGQLVVLVVKHEGASTTISITDSAGGNTWTSGGNVPNTTSGAGDHYSEIFYSVLTNGNASHTFTANFAAARTFRSIVGATANGTYSIAGGSLDATAAGGSGVGTSPDAGSLTTSAATISFVGTTNYSSSVHSAAAGWTIITSPGNYISIHYRIDASSGTYDPISVLTPGQDWTAHGLSFKEASAPVTARFTMLKGM